ncbi:MAG: sulfatase-like hydrolase/transferase [Vicinamibacterales bacterium]
MRGARRLAAGLIVWGVLLGSAGCGRAPDPAAPAAARPSILLVTLDTTRADAVGPDATRATTPAFDALAARGLRFRQAYATVPETLPSHTSMLTGLYPAGHGLHENGRDLDAAHAVVAARLHDAGYRTAAFVSAFVLARRFGLARGFDVYDDALGPDRVERRAPETTDRAIAWLDRADASGGPLFVWVHYFDPHAPYDPPEPYRGRHPDAPYFGEVEAMDAELGRLLAAFEARVPGPRAVIVAGDHGEGLGEHGEAQHGRLLYQATMHVPLVISGPGVAPGVDDAPVSLRRVFHTVLDWAGLDRAHSLRPGADGRVTTDPADAVVLGEAMKPFLEHGWQPQVMAVAGGHKAILTGSLEWYDLAADPGESRDLSRETPPPAPVREAIEAYPIPTPGEAVSPSTLDAAGREALATLGYVGAGAAPVVRRDAPRPVDMAPWFDALDRASTLFVQERWADVVPVLERILAADRFNLDATLRLATAQSMLGHDAAAIAAFDRAREIAPRSVDVRLYLGLHYARGRDWAKAVPLLEQVLAESPRRLPALEALARLRQRQERVADAVDLYQRAYALRAPTAEESIALGQLAMAAGRTAVAIEAFERARAAQGAGFSHDLELGVLLFADRRLAEARDALDRVPPTSRDYPMALFKRAQVSVLLGEPDRAARVARAREHADATTRPLIANERLFQGIR